MSGGLLVPAAAKPPMPEVLVMTPPCGPHTIALGIAGYFDYSSSFEVRHGSIQLHNPEERGCQAACSRRSKAAFAGGAGDDTAMWAHTPLLSASLAVFHYFSNFEVRHGSMQVYNAAEGRCETAHFDLAAAELPLPDALVMTPPCGSQMPLH